MYIIVIAWLYVTILMAATEATVVAGLLSLVFYGLLPVGIFIYLFGTPARRRAKIEAARSRLPQQPAETKAAAEQSAAQLPKQALDPVVGADNGHNTQQN